jgi:hypothetical protein
MTKRGMVLLLLLACGRAGEPARTPASDVARPAAQAAAPATRLYVWAGDGDRADPDFLAVLDVAPGSPAYGRVLATVPVDARGTMPHHTEHRMPPGGRLFANGFMSGTTFVFDLTDSAGPSLAGSFGGLDGYTHPHSYERLPNGNVLVTVQGRGESNVDPGGLVEVDGAGNVVRSASAADPAQPDANLRPYSLAIVPALDRVVTTSYDMGEDMGFRGGRRGRTRHVQVWRLSDLALLATIPLPGARGEQPGEPRVLADGETVLVATFTCGLFRMTGLATERIGAELVHAFEGGGCALPVVVGGTWVQSVPSAHTVVSLDVTDPARPREVSRVTLGSRNYPHWLAFDPGGGRIGVADRGDGEPRLFMLRIDAGTGELSVDGDFRDEGAERPGVSFGRGSWPHGDTGPAKPHGTVFGP